MLENLKEVWSGISPREQYGLIGGAVLIFLLTIILGWWLMRTDYEVLFADLEARDAASIVKELEKQKIDYVLGNNGNDILVDKNEVHQSRLSLMGQGAILNGYVGFEIFDKSGIGMTEYSQKINYQRALQGELARTVSSIDAVKFARIHLVLPASSIFKQKSSKPKASVSVVIKLGQRLGSRQIAGIQRLVAASVPDLSPDTVTIVDQRGFILSSEQANNTDMTRVGTRFEIKREVEAELSRKVTSILDKTFGAGKAIVSVDVSLNMDHIKRTTENIIPVNVIKGRSEGLVVKKRQNYQRKPTLTQTASVGVGVPVSRPTYANTSSEIEYKYGKSIEQIVTAPGGIKRLSVSVLVPGELDNNAIAELKNVVTMAIGLDSSRGDGIAVYPIKNFIQNSIQLNKDGSGIPVDSIALMQSTGGLNVETTPTQQYGWLGIRRGIADLIFSVRSDSFVLASFFSAIAVILLVVWFLMKQLSGRSRSRMNSEERQQLVDEIKNWLREDDLEQSR